MLQFKKNKKIKKFWDIKVHVVEETPLYVVNAPMMKGIGVLPKHLHCCTPKWSMKGICVISCFEIPQTEKIGHLALIAHRHQFMS